MQLRPNLLAATVENPAALNQVYNVALGKQTSLNTLFELLRDELIDNNIAVSNQPPRHVDFRKGDVRHSLAEISKARELLEYAPEYEISQGIKEAMPWYIASMKHQ